jgi:hypothetical protein
MNPNQIMQLHGSSIIVCIVVKNNSIPFNLFNVYELAQSTARCSATETAQTYRHKYQTTFNRIHMKQTQTEQTQGY